MPLDIDRFAHLQSPIQRWDPRLKIAALGLLAFGIALLKTLPVSAVALVIAVAVLMTSALPLQFVSHGLAFVSMFLVPFFLIMPFTYPGTAAFHFLGLPFAWEGLRLATLIFIKAIAIVMTTFAIFATARFDVSMVALQRLKVPRIMVQMLLFTYRYTFVFLEEMRRMQISMRARGFVPKTNMYTMTTMGNFVGTLLVRSFERTERVYKAMLSKGYQGEFHTLVRFDSSGGDMAKALLAVVIMAGLLAADFSGMYNVAVKGWY